MNHTFTDDQINDAKHSAARHMSRDWISRFNVKDLRAFLDALPEPQDEWEQCRFEDIRKGDRVKNVLVRESGQIHTKEGVANKYQADESGEGLSWWFMGDYDQYIARSDEPHDGPIQVTLYRIPAPVQHPDPEEHPVIIDEAGRPWFSAGLDEYHSPHHHSIFRNPRDFETWTPAKVVADDE